MPQQLRVLAAFADDVRAIPRTYIMAHNHPLLVLRDPIASSGLFAHQACM